jgi:hypothetical protein
MKYLCLGSVACVLVGCGGAGQSASSLQIGTYSGSVVPIQTTSIIVDLTVSPNGTIIGTSTMLSLTSGAIDGRATVKGNVNPTDGTFSISGTFQFFLPPPPNGAWEGPITVTGVIPHKGSIHGQMDVTNASIITHGSLDEVVPL